MGAGKSTLSHKLAHYCNATSYDIDIYIAHKHRQSVSEIFQTHGQEYFREKETEVLRQFVSEKEPHIVSCGAGIVESKDNIDLLKGEFVLFLDVPALEGAHRITNPKTRPLLADMAKVSELEEKRRPLYEQIASARLDVSGKVPHEAFLSAVDLLEKEGVICRLQK